MLENLKIISIKLIEESKKLDYKTNEICFKKDGSYEFIEDKDVSSVESDVDE